MSDGEGKAKLLGSAPSGSKKRPVTEVIDDSIGPSLRRIRKLRVVIVDVPEARDVGTTRIFAQDEVRIGSSPDVDVTLRDAAVSREHLAVRLGPHGFSLTDTGSTNGTFHNEDAIGFKGRRELRDGDKIRFGGFSVITIIVTART